MKIKTRKELEKTKRKTRKIIKEFKKYDRLPDLIIYWIWISLINTFYNILIEKYDTTETTNKTRNDNTRHIKLHKEQNNNIWNNKKILMKSRKN